MPSNYTQNYKLNQWEPEDQVLRTDFNADNVKIDEALQAEAEARGAADRAEMEARTSADTAINATLANHTAQLALRGNCQIYTTSYVGDGKSGEAHPITLTFPHKPVLLAVMSTWDTSFYMMVRGCESAHYLGGSNYVALIQWEGNTVSWYGDGEWAHMSREGATYNVVALLAMD